MCHSEVPKSAIYGWTLIKNPEELILDFDATNDPVHGDQLCAVFHGYYDQYCFLPLYVFCGEFLLAVNLRPGDSDAAKHAWGILAFMVKKLRQEWLQVKVKAAEDRGRYYRKYPTDTVFAVVRLSLTAPVPAGCREFGRWISLRCDINPCYPCISKER